LWIVPTVVRQGKRAFEDVGASLPKLDLVVLPESPWVTKDLGDSWGRLRGPRTWAVCPRPGHRNAIPRRHPELDGVLS
jgi:hypothetical protein